MIHAISYYLLAVYAMPQFRFRFPHNADRRRYETRIGPMRKSRMCP